jgi:hypothetical protein
VSDRKIIKRIRSADNKHEVEVYQRADGLFGYVGHSEYVDGGDTYWTPTELSGIYDSVEAAERGALADLLWLRSKNSN